MNDVELLTRLSEAASAKEVTHKAYTDTNDRVLDLIVGGLSEGVPVVHLAKASGLSVPRIYQIKRTILPSKKTASGSSKPGSGKTKK